MIVTSDVEFAEAILWIADLSPALFMGQLSADVMGPCETPCPPHLPVCYSCKGQKLCQYEALDEY